MPVVTASMVTLVDPRAATWEDHRPVFHVRIWVKRGGWASSDFVIHGDGVTVLDVIDWARAQSSDRFSIFVQTMSTGSELGSILIYQSAPDADEPGSTTE